MHINMTLPTTALKETEIRAKNLFTSVRFNIEGTYMIIRVLTLEKVEITLKFRPGVEQGKIILQDATVEGALGLANLSESWILSKIDSSLKDLAEKVAVHDFHMDADKIYVSFSTKKQK